MKTSSTRLHKMRKTLLPAFGLLALSAGGLSSCKKVTCGDGTELNSDGTQCVATQSGPNFNVIVEDFNVGQFAFTNVDVPEQLAPGYPSQRTFTITNTGTDAQPVVYVRVGIVPVTATIQELRDEIAAIKSPASCSVEADCSVSTNCNTTLGECELDASFGNGIVIENLAAGESRDISYEMAVPLNWEKTGLYGILFSVNEVPLIKGADGVFTLNPELNAPTGESRLAKAGALYAPSTVIVGIPDKPNLRVLYGTVDSPAFEAMVVENAPAPLMTLTARLSAQGKDVVAPVTVRFELSLPGHVVQTPGQDLGEPYFTRHQLDFAAAPATTTYVYDPGRKFNLGMQQEDGVVTTVTLEPRCLQMPPEGSVDTTCLHTASIENEVGADLIGRLVLSMEDTRLLSTTLAHPTQNPDVDQNHEIHGTLRVITATTEPEYEINGVALTDDNVLATPVVFMAEDRRGVASDTDGVFAPDTGNQADMVPCCGPYPEVESLTPTKTGGFGNEWLGANFQIKNTRSNKRQFSALVATRFEADNFARANILKNQFDLVVVQANLDYGTRRNVSENRSNGIFRVMGITYLDFTFNSANCVTEDGVETCMIVELTSGSGDDDKAGAPKPPPSEEGKKKKIETSYEKETYFTIGPVPFMVKGAVGAELGWVAGIAIFSDVAPDSRTGATFVGVKFVGGLVAGVGVKAFGGITIGIARAGIEGTATLIEATFAPSLAIGWAQKMDETANCWTVNTGHLAFVGSLDFKELAGKIAVVAYLGIKACILWVCVNWEAKVLDYTICKFDGFKQSIPLWAAYADFGGGPGVCGDASDVFATPKAAPSYSLYGANAAGTGTYAKTFTVPAGKCAKMEVSGVAESNYDYVKFYDQAGTLLASYTGTQTSNAQRFCNISSITAKFTSDASVENAGYTVKFSAVP